MTSEPEQMIGYLEIPPPAEAMKKWNYTQVNGEKLRRFIGGAVPDFVLVPRTGFPLRVLEPVTRFTGEADDDDILPTVAADVVRPKCEVVAVASIGDGSTNAFDS